MKTCPPFCVVPLSLDSEELGDVFVRAVYGSHIEGLVVERCLQVMAFIYISYAQTATPRMRDHVYTDRLLSSPL